MEERKRTIPGLAELIENQKAFDRQKSELERDHMGKYALFSRGELKETIEDEEAAYEKGYAEYGEGKFSLLRIGAEPESCGSARPYTLEELQADGFV